MAFPEREKERSQGGPLPMSLIKKIERLGLQFIHFALSVVLLGTPLNRQLQYASVGATVVLHTASECVILIA